MALARANSTPNNSEENCSGLVCKVTPTRITVAFDDYYDVFVVHVVLLVLTIIQIFNYEHTVVLHKLANDVTYKRMKESLLLLQQEKDRASDNVKNVLFGFTEPTFAQQLAQTQQAVSEKLNDSQVQAIKFALSANGIVAWC